MMLIDGNDKRGIDVALMTKKGHPSTQMRSHVDATKRSTTSIMRFADHLGRNDGLGFRCNRHERHRRPSLSAVQQLRRPTTVGMIQPGVAFDPAALPESAVVYDLVSNPSETELLRRTRDRSIPATNGLGMLVAQAEIAFERWTGVTDAGPIMRAALAADLDGSPPGA
jgi:shikimate 5-dehydrogenase